MDKEKVILCNVALFNMRATVFYPDNTTDAVAVTDLIKYIPNVCHNDGIYKVHMFGNKEYITENVIHGSDSLENALIEIKRFFGLELKHGEEINK